MDDLDHDENEPLDIDGAIVDEDEEEKIPDGFHATDPETGLPVPDEDLDDEDDEVETF